MANRYWRCGGGGTWSSTNTTCWSTTSGGAGGASVPGISDIAIFDSYLLSGTVTISTTSPPPTIRGLTITSTNGAAISGSINVSPGGSGAGITVPSSGSMNLTGLNIGVFSGTFTGTKTIGALGYSGAAVSVTLGSNLNCSSFEGSLSLAGKVASISGSLTGSFNSVTLGGGTLSVGGSVSCASLSLGGGTVTCGSIILNSAAGGTLTFDGGTINVTGSGTSFRATSGLTIVAGTGVGKISMSSASAKEFDGNSYTFPCTLENSGAGALTVTGNNTITTISNSVSPTSFLFRSGQTTTVTNFNVSGTSGNLVTITSTSGGASQGYLSKASGTVSVSYCNISSTNVSGGATWKALLSNGNVNSGNNTGWDFGSIGNGLFFGSNF